MHNPMIKLTIALLEKKMATMSRDELESMHHKLSDSEKATTEIGQAMLECIQRCLERGAQGTD